MPIRMAIILNAMEPSNTRKQVLVMSGKIGPVRDHWWEWNRAQLPQQAARRLSWRTEYWFILWSRGFALQCGYLEKAKAENWMGISPITFIAVWLPGSQEVETQFLLIQERTKKMWSGQTRKCCSFGLKGRNCQHTLQFGKPWKYFATWKYSNQKRTEAL